MKRLVLISLAVAVAALLGPWAALLGREIAFLPVGVGLTILWLALVVRALFKFKNRGLWLLLELPLVLFWPCVYFMIAWGCAHNGNACP